MISDLMQKRLASGGGPIRTASDNAARLALEFGADAIFDFTLGNPSGPVPDKVKETIAAIAADKTLDHGYSPTAGFDWVRKNIADSLHSRFGTPYKPEHIIMTVGASGALAIAFCSLVDPGDEVLLITPYYPGYTGFITLFKAVPVAAKSDPVTLQPDIESLRACITPKTKVLIVNSPNNPSGAIYTQETAEAVTALLLEKEREYGHPIYLISDEPYRELLYTDAKLPVWANLYPDSIMAYSFSKSFALPGERIGYAAVSPRLADCATVITAMISANSLLGYVGAPAFFQRVVGACVDVIPDAGCYAENRRILYTKLIELGFTVAEPQGAFYIFLKSPLDDEAEFLAAAARRHLIFVGGSAFGCPGYVRIAFCVSRKTVENSLAALELLAKDCGL